MSPFGGRKNIEKKGWSEEKENPCFALSHVLNVSVLKTFSGQQM